MIDAGLDKLPRLFRLYEDAQNDLKRIQGLFVDQKELLAIYEPGIRKLVSCIAEEIRLVMTEIIISEQVDVRVNLEGPNIDGPESQLVFLVAFWCPSVSTNTRSTLPRMLHMRVGASTRQLQTC